MNIKTLEEICSSVNKPLHLRKASKRVITYRAEKPTLKIKGVFEVLIETRERFANVQFFVAETTEIQPSRLTFVKTNLHSCRIADEWQAKLKINK